MGKSLVLQRQSWHYKAVVNNFIAEVYIIEQVHVSLTFLSALHVFTHELMEWGKN